MPPRAPLPARDIQGSRGQAHAAHGREPRAGGNDNQGHIPPSTSTISKLIAAWRGESPISFQDLANTDGPRGTKAGQHELSTHSQRHISKLILKSLLDNTSNRPEPAVLPLVRTHASIGSCATAQAAAVKGLDNVHIADASLFPEQMSCHPVMAVYAVATRVADLLVQLAAAQRH